MELSKATTNIALL